MKKLFFVIVVFLLSLNVFSQEKIKKEDLIGYWSPNEKATQLFFWKDSNGVMQVQEISSVCGKPLNIIKFEIYDYYVYVKTIFIPNDWTTENEFVFVDKTTLKCTVTGDGDGVIYYKKIK